MTATTQETDIVDLIDRAIVHRVIADALAAGYCITVIDGEDCVLSNAFEAARVIRAMFSTETDTLVFRHIPGPGQEPRRVGWVQFIYGNSGWDVIADASSNPETDALTKGAEALGDEIEAALAEGDLDANRLNQIVEEKTRYTIIHGHETVASGMTLAQQSLARAQIKAWKQMGLRFTPAFVREWIAENREHNPEWEA